MLPHEREHAVDQLHERHWWANGQTVKRVEYLPQLHSRPRAAAQESASNRLQLWRIFSAVFHHHVVHDMQKPNG